MKKLLVIVVFFNLLSAIVMGCRKDEEWGGETNKKIAIKNSVVFDTVRTYAIDYDTIRIDTIVYDTILIDSIVYDTIRIDSIVYDTIKIDNVNESNNPDYSTISRLNVYASNSLEYPLLVAHRGYIVAGPHNSIPSFIGAGKMGFWGIETDLRITKDKIVVCMHDPTIDHTTNGKGKIIDYTYEELRQFRLKDQTSTKTKYHYEDFSEEELRIPTLDDFLSICAEYECIPFIELKVDWGIIDILIEAIERHNLNGKCYIISSNIELLKKVREKGCQERIQHIHSNVEYIGQLLKLGNAVASFKIADCIANSSGQFDYEDYHPTNPKQLMEMCHKIGLGALIVGGDDRTHAIKSIETGVDYMFTNYLYSLE